MADHDRQRAERRRGLNLGLYVPAGTPAAIVSRLDAELLQILKDAALRKRFVELGMDVTPVSQAALAERIRSEAARSRRSSSKPA